MAKRTKAKATTATAGTTTGVTGYSFTRFSWQNILMAAGIAFLAPYLIRRVMPLLGDISNTTLGRFGVAGRDSVRDAADDLNVGGVSGKLDRGVDRVVDHISH